MKRVMIGAALGLALSGGLTATAGAAGAPAGTGSGGTPSGVACQQAGMDTLRQLGLLSTAARDGIAVTGVGVVPFPEVLALHRSDPELFQTGGVSVVIPAGTVAATWCDPA